jgi:predicted transcriptional regulator
MASARFDELIHAPTRLSIVSLLAASEWAEFQFIRDSVGLSDSALSKQLATLERACCVRSARCRLAGNGCPSRQHHPAAMIASGVPLALG